MKSLACNHKTDNKIYFDVRYETSYSVFESD